MVVLPSVVWVFHVSDSVAPRPALGITANARRLVTLAAASNSR